ncbi:MAG: serine hydrolase domain-containing protein [Balneolaceae bacterium]
MIPNRSLAPLHHPEISAMQSAKSVLQAFLILVLTALFHPLPAQELPAASPESAGFSSERLDRLTTTLDQYVDQQRLAGGVLLVAGEGKSIYYRAFGMRDLQSGEAMSKSDIFRIASQTKAIVSTAVLMLQEEGKLLISEPVGNYLPEFLETSVAEETEEGYTVVPARQPITIRHVLTHTSGIDYGYGPAAEEWKQAGIQGWYFAHRDEPIRETVRRIASLPMAAHPGEAYAYGYSIDVLGALIEEVSGQPLDQFLRDRILEPLQMNDTHFYLPEEKRDRLAVVYSVHGQERQLKRAPDPGMGVGQGHYVDGPRTSFSGGAGLLSTATDYTRFLQMMLNKGTLDGVRILSPTSVQLMTTDHLGEIPFRRGEGFGLGFYTVQHIGERGLPGATGEFGWSGAYHSTYWVDPTHRITVVFLTQLIPATGSDIREKVRALIYQAMTR